MLIRLGPCYAHKILGTGKYVSPKVWIQYLSGQFHLAKLVPSRKNRVDCHMPNHVFLISSPSLLPIIMTTVCRHGIYHDNSDNINPSGSGGYDNQPRGSYQVCPAKIYSAKWPVTSLLVLLSALSTIPVTSNLIDDRLTEVLASRKTMIKCWNVSTSRMSTARGNHPFIISTSKIVKSRAPRPLGYPFPNRQRSLDALT